MISICILTDQIASAYRPFSLFSESYDYRYMVLCAYHNVFSSTIVKTFNEVIVVALNKAL